MAFRQRYKWTRAALEGEAGGGSAGVAGPLQGTVTPHSGHHTHTRQQAQQQQTKTNSRDFSTTQRPPAVVSYQKTSAGLVRLNGPHPRPAPVFRGPPPTAASAAGRGHGPAFIRQPAAAQTGAGASLHTMARTTKHSLHRVASSAPLSGASSPPPLTHPGNTKPLAAQVAPQHVWRPANVPPRLLASSGPAFLPRHSGPQPPIRQARLSPVAAALPAQPKGSTSSLKPKPLGVVGSYLKTRPFKLVRQRSGSLGCNNTSSRLGKASTSAAATTLLASPPASKRVAAAAAVVARLGAVQVIPPSHPLHVCLRPATLQQQAGVHLLCCCVPLRCFTMEHCHPYPKAH